MAKENLLTDEENKYYFNLYKNGDTKARDILILKNMGLVGFTLKKMNLNYDVVLSSEDLFYTGVTGLIQAVDNYDINKNVKFSTCAVKYIMTSIRSEIRKKRIIAIDSIEYNDNIFEIDIPYYEDGFDNAIDKESIRASLNILTEHQREVIKLYYGIDCEQMSSLEICEHFNFTKVNLYLIIRTVECKLKKYFNVDKKRI